VNILNVGVGALRAIRLTRSKSALAVLAVIATIVVIGILGWMRFFSPEVGGGMQSPIVPVDDVPVAALGYARSGDVDSGLAYYDSQIDQRKDATEKWQLLLYKSSFSLTSKRYEEAIDAAKQADAIKSDLSTAVALARAYEGSGDRRQAFSYYKKALDLSPKDGLGSRSNYIWEQKIKELQP
jgi:tetratricopeptide (TPR) repeat protein